MLGHILNAGIRALAASIILGGVLMFAVGGPDSPKARPLSAAILVGFFIFWIVFIFMFGHRVPRPGPTRRDRDLDDNSPFWSRARRRESDDPGHSGEISEGGDAGGSD